MRSYLSLWASLAVLATTALPAHAFKKRQVVLPVPQTMSATVADAGCGSCGSCGGNVEAASTPPVYDPARNNTHLLHRWHLHNNYPQGNYPAMPAGPPPEPPYHPQQYTVLPLNIPRAPDFNNPGPNGVYPWFPPFQGMLLPPPRNNNAGPGVPVMGGGGMVHPGVFGVHPFARSPRDFFMSGDCGTYPVQYGHRYSGLPQLAE
jgi:hypothetical protein